MTARITSYSFDEMTAYPDSKRTLLNNIVGLNSIKVLRLSENQAMIIAEYDNAPSLDAATSEIMRILQGMSIFMTAAPSTMQGEEVWQM